MKRHNTLITTLILAAAICLGLAQTASAKMTTWKPTQGKKFRGEPAAIMGPLAIFKTGKVTSSRVALNLLTPADCVRFYNELNEVVPPKADDWADATSRITREMFGAVRKLEDVKLIQVDLHGRPEPDYVLLFNIDYNRKRTWDIMKYAIDDYPALKAQEPDNFEAFFFGHRMGDLAYLEVATDLNLPWLMRDPADRNRMEHILELLPPKYAQMVLATRNGVPIIGTRDADEAAVDKTIANIKLLLSLDRPGAIGAMQEREYFYRAVQPAVFASGSAGPIIVADPLSPEALKLAGVQKLQASLEVGADGTVTNVTMSPENTLTEELSANLAKALQRARFVPGVKDGEWVASTYDYHL